MNTNINLIDFVDEYDNIIGRSSLEEIKKEKKIYRLIAVFVFNKKKELFLQIRNSSKSSYPNYYESSVGGHVESGESYEEAAMREMNEELGINEILKFICKKKIYYGDFSRFVSLFSCVTKKQISISKKEISRGNFYKISKIKEMIKKGNLFTPVFLELFKEILNA